MIIVHHLQHTFIPFYHDRQQFALCIENKQFIICEPLFLINNKDSNFIVIPRLFT